MSDEQDAVRIGPGFLSKTGHGCQIWRTSYAPLWDSSGRCMSRVTHPAVPTTGQSRDGSPRQPRSRAVQRQWTYRIILRCCQRYCCWIAGQAVIDQRERKAPRPIGTGQQCFQVRMCSVRQSNGQAERLADQSGQLRDRRVCGLATCNDQKRSYVAPRGGEHHVRSAAKSCMQAWVSASIEANTRAPAAVRRWVFEARVPHRPSPARRHGPSRHLLSPRVRRSARRAVCACRDVSTRRHIPLPRCHRLRRPG